MSRIIRAAVVAACLAAFVVPSSQAATYFVPSDGELIQKSDDIVVATGVTSLVELDARGGIVTRFTLRVEETFKGDYAAGDYLVLTERGGLLDGKIKYIPGTPAYESGVRYLVFTETNNALEPTTFGMALGQFHFVAERGRSLLLRSEIYGFDGNLGSHVERARDAEGFVEYIRGIVAHSVGPEPVYFVDEVEPEFELKDGKVVTNATRTSYLMQQGGQGFRWSTPTTTFVKSGAAVGPDGNAAVSQAFSEWNGTSSNINYSDGGQDNTALGGLVSTDGKDAILFNDPNNEVGSAAGVGGISAGGNVYTVDGETFFDMIEVDVVMNNGSFAQNCYNSVMTHEVGHTLGFRHSDQPPSGGVSSNDAIMRSSVQCSWNGVLKTYDQDAASTVYGAGAVCNPPTITTQPPANRNVAVGAPTTFTVVAGGTSPFTYQWFVGSSGDTSTPATGSTATTSSLGVTLTSPGSLSVWVRVTNACSSINSNTATITATCAAPAITGLSSSLGITEGNTTQLSVTATGSGLTYQWYVGSSGNTTSPIAGANASARTVSPTVTTSYWVRVSGTCGSPDDSNTITVTVTPCAASTVDAPTATPGTSAGNYNLTVTAFSTSTPLTFTWFRGGTPGFGGTQIGTGQSINTTVTLAMGPTLFWARVTNGCGRVEFSQGITLAACTLPSITTQPTDATVNLNQAAQLSIVTSAGAAVTWFRGVVGNTSDAILTGATITTPPLAVTTQFWAQVTNSCGSVSSRQVTVTVSTVQPLTELVPMLNNRFFVQVRYINQFENPPFQGRLLGSSLFKSSIGETAIFTFGDPKVVELMVRLSDVRPFGVNRIDLYLGGLSDVEFYVVVTDSQTGIVKEYHKPANQLLGIVDRTTFPGGTSLQDGLDALMASNASLRVAPAAETSTIRLLNNRFEVRLKYRNQFATPLTEGYLNARSIATASNTETAVFYFDENIGAVEWMVRFSDARPFANRIDFFHGGLSDVELIIEVLDTSNGQRKEYRKGPFSLTGQVDRESFKP